MHCLAELPHLSQLQEEFGNQMVTISWNLDHDDSESGPTEALQQSVLDKLVQLNVTCQNVISSDPIQEVLSDYEVFGLPATLVFGSDGKLVHLFEGAFTYDKDVAPFVRELLAKAGP
jgi:thiol-disulfide isomerase/thioredoxin